MAGYYREEYKGREGGMINTKCYNNNYGRTIFIIIIHKIIRKSHLQVKFCPLHDKKDWANEYACPSDNG